MKRHRVVIVGGGFAGLAAAKGLARGPFEVTLVDRRNYHLFQPLLYQVATGGLSPADISAPIRGILHRLKSVRVLLDEAVGLDATNRILELRGGEVAYDSLIVATGVRHHYFGHPEWEETAPGLKTIDDATEIRGRVLRAFEEAERETEGAARTALLTFVVVGGGATGVELAGAIAELARHTLKRDFRAIDSSSARIVLIEGADRVLPPFRPELSAAARRSLERLGVEVQTGSLVESVDGEGVSVRTDDRCERLAARTVLWAAGVRASSLAEPLAAATGAAVDRAGRLRVGADLTLEGHPEIFVLGDLGHFEGADGKPLPGVAPVAMQQGRYAARAIRRRLAEKSVKPFRYRDRGSLAVIGRAAGVADLGFLRFTGPLAWLLWLFIHILYLVGFENRVLVLVQWAYSYFTHGRTARLITGRDRGHDSFAPPPDQ